MNQSTIMKPNQRDQATFDTNRSVAQPYTLGPDSMAQEGVPCGDITRHHWRSEQVYPGTERDYWVYVPKQYDGSQAACLMVFQDAEFYLGSEVRVPVVFDNLIHKRETPVNNVSPTVQS